MMLTVDEVNPSKLDGHGWCCRQREVEPTGLLERAGLPVSADLRAIAEKRHKTLESNARRQANRRMRIKEGKKNEDIVAGSHAIVEVILFFLFIFIVI